MQDFWKKINKPILTVAPMSGVTDQPFRAMLSKYGRPDVLWTEFVSADGLFSKGKEHCLEILKFDPDQRPIVAQVFGGDPVYFAKTAKLLMELGFDGIDINMGCPHKDIEKKGGGAALMKDIPLAKEIIRAIKREAPDFPISVKTRIGYSKNEINNWIPALLEENISALTVHFRTREELFCPPAHWELAKEVIKLRDKYSPDTLLIGNGDVKSLVQAKDLIKKTGLDGIMVGRGAIGNPWIFCLKEPTTKERLKAMIEHAQIFMEFYPEEHKHFERMKKHFHAYCKGFVGAKELRDNLMRAKGFQESKKLIREFKEI